MFPPKAQQFKVLPLIQEKVPGSWFPRQGSLFSPNLKLKPSSLGLSEREVICGSQPLCTPRDLSIPHSYPIFCAGTLRNRPE